jgi:fructose-bisphosphate aldolase class II
VPIGEVQRGIRHGVRKINVETDARLATTGAIREFFAERPAEFEPRAYLAEARDAMRVVYEQRMEQFGQAGHAHDYEPKPLVEMRELYRRSQPR